MFKRMTAGHTPSIRNHKGDGVSSINEFMIRRVRKEIVP